MRPGYYKDKDAVLANLRKIEGQIRGLQRMVGEDVYCIDILTQISAASGALRKVAVALLEDHLALCMAEGTSRRGETRREMVDEATAAIERLVR